MFLTGLLQTLIGSGLGFGLGMVAFHYQQNRQAEKETDAAWRTATSALNLVGYAAVENMRALTVLKLTMFEELREEANKLFVLVDEFHSVTDPNRLAVFEKIKEQANQVNVFWTASTGFHGVSPPAGSEYSMYNNHMPALTLFVQKASISSVETAEHINSRNILLQEFRRDYQFKDDLTEEILVEYIFLLSEVSLKVCNAIDFGLFCWNLALEQMVAYHLYDAKHARIEGLLKPSWDTKTGPLLPDRDLVPALREKLEMTFPELQ